MEEQSAILDVLPECSVCFDKLDVTSRVLPCQHTFCMRCLQQIIDARNELRCPECREQVPVRQVTELPTNILLVRILDGLKRPAPARPKSSSPPGGRTNKLSEASGSSRSASKNASSSSQPHAKALYKYDAQEPMDLSFAKGDTIYLRRKIDENWFQGELNGTVGFFPASYVHIVTPLPPEPPQCKALYDFEVNQRDDKDCLTFLKDEILKVIRRIDANWVEGQKGDKIGIFPLSFVELNGSAKHLIDSQAPPGADGEQGSQEGSGNSKKSSNKRHSFTSLLTNKSNKDSSGQSSPTTGASGENSNSNRHSMEISSPVLVRSSNPTAANLIDTSLGATGTTTQVTTGVNGRKKPPPLTITNTAASNERPPNSPTILMSPTSQAGGATITTLPSSPKPKVEVRTDHHLHHAQNIFVAMYSYKPQKADELELRKNEFYTVNEKCKDGWFKGMSLRTGELGVFPGNYMQPYRHDRQRKSSTTASSSEGRPTSPLVTTAGGRPTSPLVTPAGSPRLQLASSVATPATTTSPTSQAAPVVRMRSPGTTPTSSATTQTPLSGMTTSTSSPMIRSGSFDAQKRSNLIAADGQKTIAQLKSERAAQLMQYYQPPPGGNGQHQAARQQGTNLTGKMSPSGHQERPRGSPPPVSPQQGSGSPRSNTLQHQQAVTSKAGHTQGSRTVSRNPQSAGQSASVAVSSGARTKTSAQLASGSPPEQTSAPHTASRVRTISSNADGSSDGHSNGQTTVVSSSSSTAVLRNNPSNALPSPGQQVFKQANSHSAKAKRLSAHIPLTALHAVDIRLTQKPRRYSDSDHNPDRPRIVTRSSLQSSQGVQSKHAADNPMPVSPPTVPVRDSASMLPPQLAAVNTKVDKRHKGDKKTKRVPRPGQLPSEGESPGGSPTTQVRTNSLPENQPAAIEDQRRRSQNLDADVIVEGATVGAAVVEEGAVGGVVNGAIGVTERKPPKTTPLLRERYRVVVPYPPQSDQEIELKVGDTVYVHNKRSDGWFKGTLERTGRTGLFPSTFVESF